LTPKTLKRQESKPLLLWYNEENQKSYLSTKKNTV